MEVLIYLVPMALGLGLLGLVAFLWALNSGQFDDLDGAAWRAIMDDDQPLPAAPAQEGNKPVQAEQDGHGSGPSSFPLPPRERGARNERS